MPMYSVVYRHPALSSNVDEKKQAIARGITELHCKLTGTSPHVVKVFFHEYSPSDIYSAGERIDRYIRVTGQVRVGRSKEVNEGLLKGMYEVVRDVVQPSSEEDIATQIVEIEDRETVMVNGVLNT